LVFRNARQIVVEFVLVETVEVFAAVVERCVRALEERHEQLLLLEILRNFNGIEPQLDVIVAENPINEIPAWK
jgi:hypothetical protein